MKHLERVFLERKFDSDNLCTIPKKPKSAFFIRESMVFPSMQHESKKGHFELTNEEFLMIIKYMNYRIKHHYFDKCNTCSSYSCSQFIISFIDLCVLPPLLVHSSNNHSGSIIFSLGYYDLALFSLHLGS